jgi:hypothetical protein
MRSTALLFGAAALSLACAGSARADDPQVFHVSATGTLSGDGSATDPFLRITDALAAARAAADASAEDGAPAFRIEVGPGIHVGSYDAVALAAHPDWEVLPLVVNVSRLEIAGSTRIASGLRPGEAIALVDEAILRADKPLAPAGSPGLVVLQSLFFVAPTVDRPADVRDVTVRGLEIDGAAPLGNAGLGIFVDRVEGFLLEGNVFENLGSGCRTRSSSGAVIGNFGRSDGQVIICTGGSARYPARVAIMGNRCVSNPLLGMLLVANGTYKFFLDFGASGFEPLPVPTVFDLTRAEDRATVPDTLEAVLVGNDCSDNGLAGMRMFETGQRTTTFDTASLDQRIETHLRALLLLNTYKRNASWGVTLDAGFPNRTSSGAVEPDYTGTYEVDLVANDFGSGADANGAAPLWVGFTRFRDLSVFKPLRDATIALEAQPAAQLLGAIFDNPVTDTLAGDPSQTPLGNLLTVDGAVLPTNTPP